MIKQLQHQFPLGTGKRTFGPTQPGAALMRVRLHTARVSRVFSLGAGIGAPFGCWRPPFGKDLFSVGCEVRTGAPPSGFLLCWGPGSPVSFSCFLRVLLTPPPGPGSLARRRTATLFCRFTLSTARS